MAVRIIQQLCHLALLAFIASCTGSGGTSTTESHAGEAAELFSDLMGEERETVMITPAADSATDFEISPATFDTVIVRAVPGQGNRPRPVEALLKGSFPEGCMELHKMTQREAAEGESVTLTMRRPRLAICTQVVRPYRFFFELERRFSPGEYTLLVNDRAFPFVVD